MSVATNQFSVLQRQLDAELHTLASESKRRNSQIKNASDKSIKILKTVHSASDLLRHPDFVVPFTLASSSRNAKLTSIAIQCLQGLSSSECIPQARLAEVLDGFMEATHLAMEIQLKVLQVVPIFFKTYAKYITGDLCAKLLQCCANLLQTPHKSSIVAGTASATLQQLISEIFDRLSYTWEDTALNDDFEVLISNSETVKVNTYRYDANKLFAALFSALESKTQNVSQNKEVNSYLNVNELPMDYGLEILESILTNNWEAFVKFEDLQFILKIKAIPLLLRSVSSSKHFAIVVRSCRCIRLLLRTEYLTVLEIELEVILSLLIHNLSLSSKLPNWHRILVLEIFNEVSKNIDTIFGIFMSYDNFPDKKHILANLLQESYQLLKSDECDTYLSESPIIEKMDMPSISNEEMNSKTRYLQLLDKTNAPSTNHGYIIWLILNFTNMWAEKMNTLVLDTTQKSASSQTDDLAAFFNGVFPGLFDLYQTFLYSTAIDSHLFHSIVRAFQKLAYSAGILNLQEPLDKCYGVFAFSIVNNSVQQKEVEAPDGNDSEDEAAQANTTSGSYLNAISETLIGTTTEEDQKKEVTDKRKLHTRSFNSKQISLFRALVSLSISLGSALGPENWRFVFLTWQWVSYYIYGPSVDFMESSYTEDVPAPPSISKNDISSIEGSILKLFESTTSYSSVSFQALLKCLVEQSNDTLFKTKVQEAIHPVSKDKELTNCVYNKGFYITQIGEISTYNYNRFLTGNKGKDSWNLVINYFISLISNRAITSASLRLFIARVFMDIIKNATEDVSRISEEEKNNEKFSILEDYIMSALMDTIDSLSKLTITKDDVYKGVLNVESEILLQILSTLKGILNEFGEVLTHSWLTVFKVINSPFEVLKYDAVSLNEDDAEGAALLSAIVQKHLEMIQISYDVFKLVSDDFLQSLPLDIIKYVIDTLANFISQERNLNISFSSISQFWLVGDYLRSKKTPECELPVGEIATFTGKIESGKLEDILKAANSPPYEVYNGLWIYLLVKLIHCTDDKRAEIKNGAIQTFYRILDSHTNCLPPWNITFNEVLKPLLVRNKTLEGSGDYVEFYDMALKGLLKLYSTHYQSFGLDKNDTGSWDILLSFFESLFNSPVISVKYVAIRYFNNLMTVIDDIQDLSQDIIIKTHEIWTNYHIVYGDTKSTDAFNNKSEYDCVLELVNGFSTLYTMMKKRKLVTSEMVEKSLGVFNAASRYPLLPEHTSDKNKPSALQKSILEGISLFEDNQKDGIELLLLFQISKMCTLTFNTREKIEEKLGSKLGKASGRVPTFEAVSYEACEMMYSRLQSVDQDRKLPLEKEKYVIKILRNLSDVIRRKSMIGMKVDVSQPIWILASKSFRILVVKVFSYLSEGTITDSFKDEFYDIFIEAITNTIDKGSGDQQDLTEDEDIEEYEEYRSILLKPEVVSSITVDQLSYFISVVWKNSLIYQLDEIEEILVDSNSDLTMVTKTITTTKFDDLFGSIVEPPSYSNTKISIVCLKDLIHFMMQKGAAYDVLRDTTIPYLTCRVALILRRFILDESLLNKAPIPKLRRIELLTVLEGLCEIMDQYMAEDKVDANTMILKNLLLLSSLVLKTIPVSHRVDGLQDKVLKLSLAFTKLISE
ncbi:Mon2 protein [Maudiozyma humilis]|uniref:Mon2 protein n=1 Tax=Maudiozyma humilis TaxID=51915 RepID=A0AAV5S2T1_MAUHU|nr:Mon2 protein [Kazachstania humilis]